jgi:hypothetical protein
MIPTLQETDWTPGVGLDGCGKSWPYQDLVSGLSSPWKELVNDINIYILICSEMVHMEQLSCVHTKNDRFLCGPPYHISFKKFLGVEYAGGWL